MQPVTVAVADVNRDRRAGYERLLQEDHDITLLTNFGSINEAGNDHTFVNRRSRPRTNISAIEDEVARIKRLKPLVLLVNLDLSTDEDNALLLSLRHECPEVLIVLLTNDSVQDNRFMQALELGARGYLKHENVQSHLSTAIQVVGRGETWVPRKMLGNIMDYVFNEPSMVH